MQPTFLLRGVQIQNWSGNQDLSASEVLSSYISGFSNEPWAVASRCLWLLEVLVQTAMGLHALSLTAVYPHQDLQQTLDQSCQKAFWKIKHVIDEQRSSKQKPDQMKSFPCFVFHIVEE